MYYTIYKTTNKINNKIYIGKHKTKDLNDGYLGSGKLLKKAISKYGENNFSSEVIHMLDTEEEMNCKELEIVNDELIVRKDTYNIKLGGKGGWEHISRKTRDTNHINMNKAIWTDPEFIKRKSKENSDRLTRLHKEGKFAYDNFKGKSHTEESKSKIGATNSIKQKGNKNSQYGKCWIYNVSLEENKSIKKLDLESWVSKGWTKGRKNKYI